MTTNANVCRFILRIRLFGATRPVLLERAVDLNQSVLPLLQRFIAQQDIPILKGPRRRPLHGQSFC